MTRLFAFFFVFLSLSTFVSYAQVTAIKVDGTYKDSKAEGVFYILPRTGINIDLSVRKTQKIKGPYAEFADKYLGLSQVINANSTEFEITSISVNTFNEPDPSQVYFIQQTGKRRHRQPVDLYLSDQGTLIGVNGNANKKDRSKDDNVAGHGFSLPEIANPSQFERVDTIVRIISVDTTTIEQKVFKKISAAKTTEQKAKEAADFILKLDESMFNLINGYQEVNYEKGTMQYMYEQMNDLKNEYLEMFKGVTGTTTETYSFTYFPSDTIHKQVSTLCKFSGSKGVLDKGSSSGDLVQLSLENLDLTHSLRNLADQRENNISARNQGIWFCIPDMAKVVIRVGGLEKLESKFSFNQLGVHTFLPTTLTGNLELDNNTGGLRHVILR